VTNKKHIKAAVVDTVSSPKYN